MNDQLKKVRVTIEQAILSIRNLGSSRELSMSITNLERAKRYFGLCLGLNGEKSPYIASFDYLSDVIEVKTELADAPLVYPDGVDTDTKKVKYLRFIMQKLIDELAQLPIVPKDLLGFKYQGIISLIDTKMCLGEQLNTIRLSKEVA